MNSDQWLLRGARVIDVSGPEIYDEVADLLVSGGRIVRRVSEREGGVVSAPGVQVLDLRGKILVAGLIDLHVHFREPGHEYKEDIASGCRAAAAGGFTTVCTMPNTQPVNDCRSVTDLIVSRAAELASVRVKPIGAITKGLGGEVLAEMAEMAEAGIVAVSDDGRPVMHAGVMRRALEYAATFSLPVVQHAEDLQLAEGGAMHEGVVSTRIGVRAQPAQAESVMVARDVELVELTGARYHVAHVSCARTVDHVRAARERGLPVTCEVTPHHFTLTDEDCRDYDTATKVKPPLRGPEHVAAVIRGMRDGTIDCIATDHAPHSRVEKDVEFECAAPGMIGLETALPLTLALVASKELSLHRAIELMTIGPARAFGFDRWGAGTLAEGSVADLCVIDPERQWRLAELASKSTNTPFFDRSLVGRAILTMVEGRILYDLDRLADAAAR